MTIELLETAGVILGDVADEFVFVGGATVGLFITDAGGTTPRPTIDVDVIAEVASRGQYEHIAERLRACGLSEDMNSSVICRWRKGRELILDVMPASANVFGFTNPWYETCIATATPYILPSGRAIRVCSPAAFIATKLVAFGERGARDPITSHDLEDIVRVVDGRSALVEELRSAPADLREYVAARFTELLASQLFSDAVRAFVLPDPGGQVRADEVILPRIASGGRWTPWSLSEMGEFTRLPGFGRRASPPANQWGTDEVKPSACLFLS